MKKKALMILADGFEEIEAIVPVDILRRSEVEVTVAGLGTGPVTGAHGLAVVPDVMLKDYDGTPDAVILPGGMPGAENLAASTTLKNLLARMNSEKRIVAAMCASPALVLAPAGILSGKKATCYPGLEKNFTTDITYVKEDVVQAGNVITSRGPATAFKFGLKIAELLTGKAKADMVSGQMLFS